MIVLAGGSLYLLVRWLRASTKRSAQTDALAAIHASVEVLGAEVAQLQSDVAHIADSQDFKHNSSRDDQASQPPRRTNGIAQHPRSGKKIDAKREGREGRVRSCAVRAHRKT